MATPLFYPIVQYAAKNRIPGRAISLAMLCPANNVPCKMTGASTQRKIYLKRSADFYIISEAHQGSVIIGTPWSPSSIQAKRYALAAMAYALFDLCARESIRGHANFNQITKRGRPRKGRTQTNKERQRAFKLRKSSS